MLTVDATIQSITEKYLKKAYKENVAQYATAIVMRPKTGEVLAMATMPNFDPNDAFTPNTDELKQKWSSLSSKEKSDALLDMWRNKAISDTAEPGSTFKIVTATAALEENVTTIDAPGQFNCTGSMKIGTWTIKCWRYPLSHGSESLRQGIMNSCNPVFMQVSQKMGIDAYVKYLDAFNLASKTGIDLPGEATGIMHDPKAMTAVDLATTSFGQTIQITSLQTAVNYSAIANGGYLVKPYIVKEIKSEDGTFEKITESQVVKQIMSKTTADSVLSALEDTVKTGTGKAAQIRGYRVAGKTGTAEEGRGASSTYMASFAGIAPVNDPEVVVLVTIYDPKGPLGHQGSTICAPVVSSIIDETLRYLDVKPDYTLEQNNIKEKVIPNLIGKTVGEATTILSE
ncbi:Stage V sporulation protein D [compost metagenome]